MNLTRLFASAALALACAVGAQASSLGAPFVAIEGEDVSNASILDFFDSFGPSGFNTVSFAGTVSSSVGASSLVGQSFSFATPGPGFSSSATVTIGTEGVGAFDAQFGGYDFDPFQPGPGDLNFRMLALPEFSVIDGPTLAEDRFIYEGLFADWPDKVGGFPEFEVMISVYLNGPLPTRSFEDPFDGSIVEYIEGPLSVNRIIFGTVGGAPVAPVPLPASLPLLSLGLGLAFGWRRWSLQA